MSLQLCNRGNVSLQHSHLVSLPCRARPYRARAYQAPSVPWPCRAVPCQSLPCRAMPNRAFHVLAVPCHVHTCRALPCHAVPCPHAVHFVPNGCFTRTAFNKGMRLLPQMLKTRLDFYFWGGFCPPCFGRVCSSLWPRLSTTPDQRKMRTRLRWLAGQFETCTYRRLGGVSPPLEGPPEPGNRFVSFVRACARLVARW